MKLFRPSSGELSLATRAKAHFPPQALYYPSLKFLRSISNLFSGIGVIY
jgi:hypothetical protein